MSINSYRALEDAISKTAQIRGASSEEEEVEVSVADAQYHVSKCKQIEWFNLAIVRITQSRDARWRFRSDEVLAKNKITTIARNPVVKRSDGRTKVFSFTSQLSSSTIRPYWLYEFTWHKFEKLSRCQGWILQSVVSAKTPRKRRSGCKS